MKISLGGWDWGDGDTAPNMREHTPLERRGV
jgi:hypothetical protein